MNLRQSTFSEPKSGGASFPARIHPSSNGVIIINYPGLDGDLDGYQNKYRTIASHLVNVEKIGAFIQIGNHYYPGHDYRLSVISVLRAAIEYAITNGERICRRNDPKIYLMGFSAGASAIAGLCAEFQQIDKILLVAPTDDFEFLAVRQNLARYTGEIYCVAAANDETPGHDVASLLSRMAQHARVNQSRMILLFAWDAASFLGLHPR